MSFSMFITFNDESVALQALRNLAADLGVEWDGDFEKVWAEHEQIPPSWLDPEESDEAWDKFASSQWNRFVEVWVAHRNPLVITPQTSYWAMPNVLRAEAYDYYCAATTDREEIFDIFCEWQNTALLVSMMGDASPEALLRHIEKIHVG